MSYIKSTATSREIRSLEENAWSMWTVFGRGPGCSLVDREDIMAYETPISSFPYNAVFRFRVDDSNVDREVDELLARYRERGVPLAWLVHPTSRPDNLRDVLSARGLVHGETIKGMTRELENLDPVPAVPLGIEVFEGASAELDDWMRLVSWRYELEDDTLATLEHLYRLAINDERHRQTRWWGARRGDVPLSKVVSHCCGDVAGIYGVATVEDGRGLGLASLLTLAALNAARDSGCKLAVLHATPMAVGLYERLGFGHAADFEFWADPGHLHL